MRALILPALALATFAFTPAAFAQDTTRLPAAGETLLNVSASERLEVQQDLLIANLRVEMEGTDPAILQNEINTIMKNAVDKAKAVTDVKTSTDGYYVYPYDPNPQPVEKGVTPKKEQKWRGSQGITISGKNPQALLELAGELQSMGLVMGGLNYTLSPEATETARDSLMEAALAKVQAKAERAGKALGKTKVELVEVSVDAAMPSYPQPMMMRAMASDGAMEKGAAPTAEPGMSEITLTVTARALLK
ncbi:SIMPL domain-containing protein [Micavibrio aeruginosavorus]|uniref:SIMPL domain-containing protein n=1 Tax=Micavibrio aeruginosavorus TaxID=349221 RepID=UPI003F4AF41F